MWGRTGFLYSWVIGRRGRGHSDHVDRGGQSLEAGKGRLCGNMFVMFSNTSKGIFDAVILRFRIFSD